MRQLAIAVLGVALALTIGIDAGQFPSAPPQTSGTAFILGRVVEAGTNTGVPGATVTLNGPPMPGIPSAFIGAPPGGPRRVVTDAQGNFIYRDLPAASYSMAASATGYVNAMYGDTRIIQIRRTLDLVRTLDISAGDRVVPATIQLFRKGGISGRVVDEIGEPVAGAPVTIFARMSDWGGPVTRQEAFVTTDDRGMYHKDVTPGQYVVGVLGATTTWPAAASAAFVQAQSQGQGALERYMQTMSEQGGLLPRGVGTRVGPFMVSQMATQNLQLLPPIKDDGKGPQFFPTMFHPASTSMMAASVVSVGIGEEKSGVDIQLRPIAARFVSGKLLGPGGPVPGMTVRLVAQDPSVVRTSPATLIDTPATMADGNGDFTFVGIAPGAYHVIAIRTPPSAASAASMLWATGAVVVGDSDITGLEVHLQPGATISGRLVVESNGAPAPPVDALRSINIAPRPVPGSPGGFHTQPTTLRVDTSSRFASRPLAPGPYMFSVTGVPSGWVLKSVTADGQNVGDKQFTLGASGVTDVVVTITNQISTVTGVVRDADGKAASVPTVAVFPADKSLWRLPGMASRRVQVAAPGRDGRYTFRGLPAGEYYIVAADWPSADFSDGNVLTAVIPHSQRFTLLDGGTHTQDLRAAVIR